MYICVCVYLQGILTPRRAQDMGWILSKPITYKKEKYEIPTSRPED